MLLPCIVMAVKLFQLWMPFQRWCGEGVTWGEADAVAPRMASTATTGFHISGAFLAVWKALDSHSK